MITLTGLIEFDHGGLHGPTVDIRARFNNYWDEAIKDAKSAYEFNFEYDEKRDCYEFVSLKKITKTKANKNKI